MRQRHKRISILLLLAMVIQIFTPFMNNLGYAEGKEVLSEDFIEDEIENINEDNLDYLEKVRQKDVTQGLNLTDKIKLSNVELSSDGESVSFSANWEITPKETKVNTGDYFYINIEGELGYYPEQLGRDGVIGRHEGGGKYKFTIPQEFDKHEEVKGKFSAEGRIKNNGTISLGDKSIEVKKESEGENGSNNIGDGENDLDKTGKIIEEDGEYYVQWYVFIGDYNKPVANANFTDIIGEGLKLDKNSLTVRYIDKIADYSSQSEKLDSESKSALDGNIKDISLDDQKISFTVSDSRIDGHHGTIEVGYKTEILDMTKDSYTNNAELRGVWNDSSTDISVEWSSDGSSSGVMKPNLDNENISIDVKKRWKGIESLPREEIKIILLANDKPAKNSEDENLKLILSNENDWTGKFENLPKYNGEKEINYKVRECGEENGSITISNIKFSVEYTGDKENGFVIKNTKEETTENDKTKAKGEFTLKKVDSADGNIVLEGAEFTLIKDDNILEKIIKTLTKENNTITTGEDGKITFEDLEPGEYILKETKAPKGYERLEGEISIKVTENGEVELINSENENYSLKEDILTVKNTREEIELVNIEVKKEWKDSEGNILTETPEEIKVKLYNDNDEPVKDSDGNELKLILSNDNNWTDKFGNLPKYNGEKEINYKVRECGEENGSITISNIKFSVEYTGDKENGFLITNTKEEPNKPGEEDPEEPTKPIVPEPEPVDPIEPEIPEEPEEEEPEEPEEPEIPEVPEEEEPEEPEEDVGGVIVEPEEPEDPDLEEPVEPELPEEEEEPEVPEEDVGGVIVEPEEEEEEPVKPEEDVAGVVVDKEEDKVKDETPALPKTGENSTIFLILGLVFIMTGIILKRKIFA